MSIHIQRAPRGDLSHLISTHIAPSLAPVELRQFERFVAASQAVWYCEIEGKFIGMWGTIPPTLISDRAYLWFHNNETLKEHQFVYIRHSQVAIGELLEEWRELHGHAVVGASKSIRWLRWLGAEFFEPEGNLIPFVIRRKDG